MKMYRLRLKGKNDQGELIVEYRTRHFNSTIDLQEYKHEFMQEYNRKGFKHLEVDVKEATEYELFGI